MTTQLGHISGVATLYKYKRQRKSGGTKNVFAISISPSVWKEHENVVRKLMASFHNEEYIGYSITFLFKKRVFAEEAWSWIVLKFS